MLFESLTHLKKFVAFHYHVSKSLSSCQVFTEVLLIWLPCCIFFLYYSVIEFSISGKELNLFNMKAKTSRMLPTSEKKTPLSLVSIYQQDCSNCWAFFKGKMFTSNIAQPKVKAGKVMHILHDVLYILKWIFNRHDVKWFTLLLLKALVQTRVIDVLDQESQCILNQMGGKKVKRDH